MFHLSFFLPFIYSKQFTEIGRFILADSDYNVLSSDLKFTFPKDANNQDFLWDLIFKSSDTGTFFFLVIKEKILMLDENGNLKMEPVSNYNKIIEKIKKCSSHGTTDKNYCDPEDDLTQELVKEYEYNREKTKEKKGNARKIDEDKEDGKSKVNYEWVWYISDSSRYVSIKSRTSEKCLKKEGGTLISKACPTLGYNDKNLNFRAYILPIKEKIDEIESLKYNKKVFDLFTSVPKPSEEDLKKTSVKDELFKKKRNKHVHKHTPFRRFKKLRKIFKKKKGYIDNEDEVLSSSSEFDKIIKKEEYDEVEEASSSSSKLHKKIVKVKKPKEKNGTGPKKSKLHNMFKKFFGSKSSNSQEALQNGNQANTFNPRVPLNPMNPNLNPGITNIYQGNPLNTDPPLQEEVKNIKYDNKKDSESISTEEKENETENESKEVNSKSFKRGKKSHVDLDITASGDGKDVKDIIKALTSGSVSKDKNITPKTGEGILESSPQAQGFNKFSQIAKNGLKSLF